MRISFRYKLMLSYLLILLVMGGSVYFYLNRTLETSIVSTLTENLLESDPARLIDAQQKGCRSERSAGSRRQAG